MFDLEDFDLFQGEDGAQAYFGELDPISPNEGKEDEGFRSAEAEVRVTKQQVNYMPGTMHGGAVAVAAEEIARRCHPEPVKADGSLISEAPRIQSMEVHYMSPIKRRAALAAVSAVAGKTTNVTRVGLSEAGGTDGGVLCSEAILVWGDEDEQSSRER